MAKALAKAKKAAKKKPVKKIAVKKAPAKKPVKLTPQSLLNELTQKGYNVNIEEDGSSRSYVMRAMGEKYDYNMIRLRTDGLPYCCGVDEIGDIVINNRRTQNREALDLLVAYAFLCEKNDSISVPARGKGLTRATGLIFCSNGVDDCAVIERVFKTILKDHYIPTPSTINPNSGNTITIFVAKY